MPKTKATPIKLPSDELLLAAIERAERHGARHGVPLAAIKEHLGLPSGSWSSQQLRPQRDRLEATGLIEQFRAYGVLVWSLTDSSHRHLATVRQTRAIPPLPESPQHRVWREAHALAGERTRDFREELQAALGDAAGLLDAHETASSDTWQAIGERLQHVCKRLESASYCLHEWPEPDDATADIAPQPLNRRRHIADAPHGPLRPSLP
jgi:hypothetical protein